VLTCCSPSWAAHVLLRAHHRRRPDGAGLRAAVSELTKAWLLYLGLIFLFMVMYAPGGIASLIMMNLRVAAFGRLRELWVSYLALAVTALVHCWVRPP
jgi:hypothetical protein